jgi:hypothetical protein
MFREPFGHASRVNSDNETFDMTLPDCCMGPNEPCAGYVDMLSSKDTEIANIESRLAHIEARATEICETKDALATKCRDLHDRLENALAALREIARGEGRFSRDPLEHASNTIEDMKRLATDALQVAPEYGNR